jgi:chromosomal replication initiation ATPase DnaA
MDKLRDYYGEETSNVWFSKLSFMDNIENFITIKSPTGFIRDWVKTNYGLIIEKELCAYYTQGFTLEFT